MKHKVKIELSGGFRNAGIMLETKKIRLDSKFKFEGEINFFPPVIDGVAVFKGGRHAVYKIKLTINKVTKEIPGYIKNRNGRQVEDIEFEFADFNISTKEQDENV